MPKDSFTTESHSRFFCKIKIFSKKYFYNLRYLLLPLLAGATLYASSITDSDLSNENFRGRAEQSIAAMYDEDDLSACCLFAGDFINFGFWGRSIKKGKISIDQRIESQKNLYRFVAKRLSILESDEVLEVASGKGVGSVLILHEFNPKKMRGIDLSNAQVLRAKKVNAVVLQQKGRKILFKQGAAENIPYKSDRFEKILSIEAAQHFEDLDAFAHEANRVLKPGGKLAVASFFGTSDKSHLELSSMIQTIRDGIDKATPIDYVEETLKNNGFVNVKIESIGENVWEGFDKWTAQTELKNSWTRNWYKGYKNGLIDYYLITAEKQNNSVLF